MNTKRSSYKLFDVRRPLTRALVRVIALVVVASMIISPVQAAFHLWNIRELYTDSSGSLQYIEFFTTDSDQQFVQNQSITVTPAGGGMSHTFTIPSNLPGDSANRAFLIGTAGIDAAGGPPPDYIIPNSFLFAGGGTISFFGANSGSYTALPTDGVQSRIWGDGNSPNNPQNFAGAVGFVVVPEPATWTLFGLAGVGLALLLRRRLV